MADAAEIPEDVIATLRERAAVIGTFDPLRLLALVAPGERSEAEEDRILSALAGSIEEVVVADELRWQLQPEARREALHRLVAGSALDEAIAATPPDASDRFGQVLQSTLRTGSGGAKQTASTDELMLQSLANDFVGPLRLRTRQPAKRTIDPRILLARRAERRRQDYVAPRRLFGRENEAAALDRYVADGSVVAPLSFLSPPADATDRLRPLLLTGIGGSGKSALVADLMRRTQGEDWSGPIVVCLDFDQRNVALGGEREWLNELTRQIGFARPALDGALSKVRADARRHLHGLAKAREGVERLSGTDTLTVVSTMRDRLGETLGGGDLSDETLVVVLDTFEEMLVRSDMGAAFPEFEPFGLALEFTDSLRRFGAADGKPVFGSVRAVVAARANPFPRDGALLARWFEAHLEVGVLDADAAVEFLRSRGDKRIFTRARARRLAGLLPCYPLVLILLAAFARERSGAEIDATIAGVRTGDVLGAAAATRALYSRFLDRLKDHDVRDAKSGETRTVSHADLRKLAHPGLALPVVTPRLIREVLAVPSGLGEIDGQRAGDLFEALAREVWLVERIGTDAVRHVPALRRIMLPMLNGDLSPGENADAPMVETVRAVHRAAAQWYRGAGAGEADAAAFAAYHDAFLGDVAALEADQDLVRRVRDLAGDDIAAMSHIASGLLRLDAATALGLSTVEVAALPGARRRSAEAERHEWRTRAGISERHTADEEQEEAASPASPSAEPEQPPSSPPASFVKQMLSATARLGAVEDLMIGQEIEASFAAGDFETAVFMGGSIPRRLNDDPERLLEGIGDVTSHWIWKWALSCLAMGEGEKAVAQLKEQGDGEEETSDLALSGLIFPYIEPLIIKPFDLGFTLALATATVALGRAPKWKLKNRTLMPGPLGRAGEILSSVLWLRLAALSGYWDVFGFPTLPNEIEARPAVLRLAALAQQVRRPDGKVLPGPATFVHLPESLRARLERFRSSPPSLADVLALDEAEPVTLFPGEASTALPWPASMHEALQSAPSTVPVALRPALGLLLRGRTPELHDPVRAALGDVLQADARDLVDAVSQMEKLAPFWPADIGSAAIAASQASLREADYLLARLVVFLDLAGLTGALFETLAPRIRPAKRFRNVARLVQAYDELLLKPFDAVGVLPVAG